MNDILEVINHRATFDPETFVQECEEDYVKEISRIARIIADDDDIRIVSIAGPSSSGKTTTAHLLCDQLQREGEKVAVVSLDDFYLPDEQLPVLPDGRHDIESVKALDIPLMRQCFEEAIKTGKTVLPGYDFKTHSRIPAARPIDIGERGIVIAEGLHALNPLVTEVVPRKNIYKIHISVNCPIYDESGELVLTSRQIRLIRRTLRDETFRNTGPTETLRLWSGVVEGENKYLTCFKQTADIRLRTLHSFELGLYKERFCAMRNRVTPDVPCYDYFIRTLNALEDFVPIDRHLVPKDSLIREFIGQETEL